MVNRKKLYVHLLYKIHPSRRAVQRAFYRKCVVAPKENPSHQKRWAFLMTWIESASVFIMDRGDHNKNRGETAACEFNLVWHEDSRGQSINAYLNGQKKFMTVGKRSYVVIKIQIEVRKLL